MKSLFRILFSFFKLRLGKTVHSVYYLTHLGRGAFISYFNFNVDLSTISAFAIIAIFMLILHVWIEHKFKTKKENILYYALIIFIHLIMMFSLIIEFTVVHPDKINLWSSIVIYVLVEGAYHLCRSFIKEKILID